MDGELNARLRESAFFRLGLAAAIFGVAMLLTSLAFTRQMDSVWGIGCICLGYLLILTAMYRVGVRMHTRGGIVTKQEDPWSYKFGFVVLSAFGTGPLVVALSNDFVATSHSLSVGFYLQLIIMILAGLASVLSLALIWGAVIASPLVGGYKVLRKALTSHSTRTR